MAALLADAAERGASQALAEVRQMRAATEQLAEQMRVQIPEGIPNRAPGTNGDPPVFARDHPWWFAQPQSPRFRPRQLVTLEMLREFSLKYDVLRALINHLKNEVEAVPLRISARDPDDDSPATARRVQEVEDWFDLDGGLGGFGLTRSEFEKQVVEDLHVIGPAAIYLQPTRGGGIYQALAIDAATIRPRVDLYGWPGPGEDWYEQYVEGILQRGFTREEMYWRGLYPRTDSPYPDSPTEYLVLTVLAAVSADTWNREWLTNGTEPGRAWGLPADMPPNVAREWIDIFYATMEGDTRRRQKLMFLPAGVSQPQSTSRRDNDFQDFMLHLAKRAAAIIGVQLSAIGLSEGREFATQQEQSIDQTSSVGIGKILRYFETCYNYLLGRNGYRDLQAAFVTAKEEDAASRAERIQKLTGVPVWTPNRGLQELGDDPLPKEVGDVLWVPTTYQPADIALNPTEPAPAMPGTGPAGAESGGDAEAQQRLDALRLWERKALRRLKERGSAVVTFDHEALPHSLLNPILMQTDLEECETPEQVRALFADLRENVELSPVYATSIQQHTRQQIAARWRERRLAAEREA